MSRCSSSKRRMMWRLYVVSSASTRMSPGSARLTAARNVSRSTSPSCARERLLQRLVPVQPEGPRAADEVLPRAALRLVQAERRRAGERRPLERLRDAVRVVAVARLVHRRPEAVEARSRSASSCGRRAARTTCRTGAPSDRAGTSPPRGRASPRIRCVERLLLVGRVVADCEEATRRRAERPARARRAPAGSSRTPPRPRSSSCTARSRRGAACTASPPTRSTRRSGA